MGKNMIEDGGGSGALMSVESRRKRGRVDSRTGARLYYISRDDGQAYSWSSGTYNYDAGDTILLIKNTSATMPLFITRVYLSGDTETRVVIHRPTADVTSPTGTAITGVNLNGPDKGTAAEATAIRDETTNSQGDILWSGEIQAATNPFPVEFENAVILGTNQSIGIDYIADGTACDVVVFGYFDTTTGTS